MLKIYNFIFISAVLMMFGTTSFATPITVSSGTSSSTLQETFGGLSSGASAMYNGNNVSAAESFIGLTVNDPGGSGFETFSGTPTNPLALDISSASDGIYSIQGVAGLAGGTELDDIGEGVIAFLFDFDILELGLNINGASTGGSTTLFFYQNDGSLVDTITTTLFNSLTFTSTQAFRGVAIQNTDPSGQAYSNLRFDAAASTVPEPASIALLGLGLAGIGFSRKKKTA